jgi:hypothetical protein
MRSIDTLSAVVGRALRRLFVQVYPALGGLA